MPGPTVLDVLLRVASDPVRLLLNWHWKSALVSSSCRALIFLVVNLPAGRDAALAAFMTELLFRAITSGLLGSLTQSLRHAEPVWAAALAALILMPAVGHAAEYGVHSLAGTAQLAASITASVGFTCFTTLFNLFAMRRGVLIVGAGERPLSEDLRRSPRLLREFLHAAAAFGVGAGRTIWRRSSRAL